MDGYRLYFQNDEVPAAQLIANGRRVLYYNQMKTYYTNIEAKEKGFRLNLRELWEYRDLVLLLTNKTFTLSYKQTVLGPAWIVISPMLSSLMYIVIFGVIAGISTNGIPQVLFYLCSTTFWALFAESLTSNAYTFIANAHIFGKVYFPRIAVPVSNVFVSLIKFAIQMIVVAGLLVYYTCSGAVHPVWHLLPQIPLILLHTSVMGMSFGVIVSSLTTKYRDLSILVSFLMQLWMFATPIVYPLTQLPEGSLIRQIIEWNPMTAPTELFRYILTGQGAVMPGHCACSVALTIVCALLGIIIFNRVERTFMDTV